MTTFEERLERIARQSGRPPKPAPFGPDIMAAEMGVAPSRPGKAARQARSERSGPSLFSRLLMLPIAVALGGASVVMGGVVQVAVLDGGLTTGAAIPPQLGPAAFAVALIVSFLFDRMVRTGRIGAMAVTIGFVGMIWGEGQLAETYPEMWSTIYQADYLDPVIEIARDSLGLEFIEVAGVVPTAGGVDAPVDPTGGEADK